MGASKNSFDEEVVYGKGLKEATATVQQTSGRGRRSCKGPEAAEQQVSSTQSKEASLTWSKGRRREREGAGFW